MTEVKTQKFEREYIIPLRRFWLNVPQYERSRKAVKTIKKFIAKHMKILDRDEDKVKLDVYFNNEIWFRGRANPPSKVKVKAVKEGDIVKVNFIEMPEHIKFLKGKLERRHKAAEKKAEKPKEEKPEEVVHKEEEKKPEEKKIEEKEKEQAVAEQHVKETKLDVKAQKHLTKKKETGFHRMALKK